MNTQNVLHHNFTCCSSTSDESMGRQRQQTTIRPQTCRSRVFPASSNTSDGCAGFFPCSSRRPTARSTWNVFRRSTKKSTSLRHVQEQCTALARSSTHTESSKQGVYRTSQCPLFVPLARRSDLLTIWDPNRLGVPPLKSYPRGPVPLLKRPLSSP